jgi:hypothetical protein
MLHPQQPAKNWMSHPYWLMVPNQQLNNDHIQELASLELVQQSQSSQVLPYTLFSVVGYGMPQNPLPQFKVL